jgi:uncharacterized protein (TIGR02001 family)
MKNIRSFLGAAGVAAVAALGMSTAALADDDKFGYSITITGTSDYIFRGISFTDSDPAFQPFVELTYGNPNLTWYVDFWGSNVKNEFGDPWELDIYAGVRPVTGPVSWDLGVLLYTNPSVNRGLLANENGANTDYVEFKIQASYTPTFISKNLTLTGIAYMTPDQGFASPQTETFEGDWAYTLPTWGKFAPTLSGVIGHTHADNAPAAFDALCSHDGTCSEGTDDYTYWSAGLKIAVDKYFMDFRYWDTDISKSRDAADDASARFVFSAGVNLP